MFPCALPVHTGSEEDNVAGRRTKRQNVVPPPTKLESRKGLVCHAQIRRGGKFRLCFQKETVADQTNIDRKVKGGVCMGFRDIEVLPAQGKTLGRPKPTELEEDARKSGQGLLPLDSPISCTPEAFAQV